MTTLEQIQKAFEDLSDDDKEKFRQSLGDRVDESVGEQEHEDGDEDTQSAKDRVDEAIGEEEAEDKPEPHEESAEQHNREEAGESDALKALREEVAKLTARLELIERTPQKADEDVASKLAQLEKIYS